MLDFIALIFTTPEAQADPYTWSAVLLAHMMIGSATAFVVGGVVRDLVCGLAMSMLFWGVWEVAQFMLFAGPSLDCLIDFLASSLGAAFAAALWYRRSILAAVPLVVAFLLVRRHVDKEGE